MDRRIDSTVIHTWKHTLSYIGILYILDSSSQFILEQFPVIENNSMQCKEFYLYYYAQFETNLLNENDCYPLLNSFVNVT